MSTDVNLGLLLFIPYRHLESAVLAEMRRHGHDMPLGEARVFQRIDAAGSRMSDLARASELTKQTTTSIVDRLERAGYVERRVDPRDARVRLVNVSAKGRELVALTAPIVADVERRWEQHLGPEDFRHLRRILGDLRQVTDLPTV